MNRFIVFLLTYILCKRCSRLQSGCEASRRAQKVPEQENWMVQNKINKTFNSVHTVAATTAAAAERVAYLAEQENRHRWHCVLPVSKRNGSVVNGHGQHTASSDKKCTRKRCHRAAFLTSPGNNTSVGSLLI